MERIIAKTTIAKTIPPNMKYLNVLYFLNDILRSIGKPLIASVTEFKCIEYNDLINPFCRTVANDKVEALAKILQVSQKIKLNRIRTKKTFIVSILKYIIPEIGYNLVECKMKHACEQTDDNIPRKVMYNVVTYSIVSND